MESEENQSSDNPFSDAKTNEWKGSAIAISSENNRILIHTNIIELKEEEIEEHNLSKNKLQNKSLSDSIIDFSTITLIKKLMI